MKKMTKKLLAVLLAALLACSVLPVAVFAVEEEVDDVSVAASERVNAWDEHFQFILTELFDDTQYTHWKYVAQNTESIAQDMQIYTAFGLYDEAWRNAFDGSVSVATAEKILVGLIERAQVEVDTSVTDGIIETLQTAKDIADFMEKVEGYLNKDTFIDSAEWSQALTGVGVVIQIGRAWQEQRAELIEAYARVLSVQAANAYYLEMLEYVRDNAEYDILRQAATNVIADIETNLEDLLGGLFADAAAGMGSNAVEYLLRLAASTNAYTAAIMGVYNGATSIADTLFNTSDQYVLMDSMMTLFYFEKALSDWSSAVYADKEADYDKAVFAVSVLLSARSTGEETLYSYKEAQAGGIIGRIKSKIYKAVTEEYSVTIEKLALAREQMLLADPAGYQTVVKSYAVYCPVNVQVADFVLADGVEAEVYNDYGMFGTIYNEYNGEYLKVAYLYEDVDVQLVGVGDGVVTCVVWQMEDGALEDYSFTDAAVAPGSVITIPGGVVTPVYVVDGATLAMNEEYVPSPEPEVDAGTVVDAVGEVAEEEVNKTLNAIREFFQKILDFFRKLFGILD